MHDPNQPQFKPRKDLREAAFRRYEKVIAMAIIFPQTVDPKPLSPATYVARFNDAKRGFMLYSYASKEILPGTDLRLVRAYETTEGQVYIRNESPVSLLPVPEPIVITPEMLARLDEKDKKPDNG